jgi:hypothetical protein
MITKNNVCAVAYDETDPLLNRINHLRDAVYYYNKAHGTYTVDSIDVTDLSDSGKKLLESLGKNGIVVIEHRHTPEEMEETFNDIDKRFIIEYRDSEPDVGSNKDYHYTVISTEYHPHTIHGSFSEEQKDILGKANIDSSDAVPSVDALYEAAIERRLPDGWYWARETVIHNDTKFALYVSVKGDKFSIGSTSVFMNNVVGGSVVSSS